MAQRHVICRAEELPLGAKKIVQIGRKSIGIFNLNGEYFAVLNVCPHQLAPLCEGRVCGHTPPSSVGEYLLEREGEIIRCPWHGWEFDIKTGRSIFNPHRVRTATYKVQVEEEEDPSVETFPVKEENKLVVLEA